MDVETESSKGHEDIHFCPTNYAPLGRSSWACLLSTSSTTEQHPQRVTFPFCFVCVCLCVQVLYVCALHSATRL